MLKGLIGCVIFKLAPIHSGARYSQNLAVSISNPPLLLPMPIAREISERCYKIAHFSHRALRRPLAVEFEGSLVNLTRLAIEIIQGAEDDIFQSKSQSVAAHNWLLEAIKRHGIEHQGISPPRTPI